MKPGCQRDSRTLGPIDTISDLAPLTRPKSQTPNPDFNIENGGAKNLNNELQKHTQNVPTANTEIRGGGGTSTWWYGTYYDRHHRILRFPKIV